MTVTDRYDVSDLIEAQYQPGSRGRVLRNLLDITSKRMMDEIEASEQKRAVRAGMDYNYEPMEEIFAGVIKTTLR